MEDIRFTQALMDVLKSALLNELVLLEEKVQIIINELYDNLPKFIRNSFLGSEELFKASAAWFVCSYSVHIKAYGPFL